MTTIITNYSLTPGAEPAATDLEVGELGINAVDGTLFTSSDGNDVVPVTDWVAGTLPDDLTNRNTGNVGIGTADPAQRLSVAGNVEIVSDTGTIALLNSYRPDQMVDTNIFARWSGNGKDSLDTENRVGARINMVASGTWTNAVTPSYMGFETGRAGSNIVEAMRIDDTGCVLIGLDDNLSLIHI